MGYQVERLRTGDGRVLVGAGELRERIDRLMRVDGERFRRLWAYYRNPMRAVSVEGSEAGCARPYRQAQEWGMPSRITGVRSGRDVGTGESLEAVARKEVVIENDIEWRIDTLVDYLFGKPVTIRSAAPDPQRRVVIDGLVRAIVAHNGGLLFLQQLALLGSVHGFVDVLVKVDEACLAEVGAEEGAMALANGQETGSVGCGVQDLGAPPADGAGTQGGASSHAGGGGDSSENVSERGDGAEGASRAGPARETVKETPASPGGDSAETGATIQSLDARIGRIARMVRLEIVEPARALPLLSPHDYRVVEGYVQCYTIRRASSAAGNGRLTAKGRWWERLLRGAEGIIENVLPRDGVARDVLVTEVIAPDRWQRYEDEVLVAEGVNSLGRVPLVHIQNTAMPFEYAGASDVEPLIALQDELNTRLSDRANRIALQSFKMYLGKGIEGFGERPVAPGRMWTTENEQADIVEVGGDGGDSPAESLHIADLREALDKASGVSPIAAGAIKNRIGRLTSAAALRVTLISLLARTEKKRTTYGLGVQRMIELALAWLDAAGVFKTTEEERRVELHWPSPLPENGLEKLQEAEIKQRLGVAQEVVLRELGY